VIRVCDFKFLDFTPEEIIKIMEQDIKQYQKKHDYYIGIANHYRTKIEKLEVEIGKLRHKLKKERKN